MHTAKKHHAIISMAIIAATTMMTTMATPMILQSNVAEAQSDSQAQAYEDAVTNAVERAAPAVVSIIISKYLPVVQSYGGNPFGDIFGNDPFFKQFLIQNGIIPAPQSSPQSEQNTQNKNTQPKTEKKEIGGGTGFIVSPEGLILTNKHVVSDTKASYAVLLNDGRTMEAKVLARTQDQDLAIIKINGENLPTLTLGNSDTVKLGQTAIAIGNALGEFRNTVSVGIISGLARTVTAGGVANGTEKLQGVMQTDAAINPGNSGGPLLNLKGEVIGINVAVAQGAQSIGFSIPVNKAKSMVQEVRTTGKISAPYIGIRYVTIDNALKKKKNLQVNNGALVASSAANDPSIVPNSPAARAGLQDGDIIQEISGTRITKYKTLASAIAKHKVGETVNIKVRRQDKTLTIPVTLEQNPSV